MKSSEDNIDILIDKVHKDVINTVSDAVSRVAEEEIIKAVKAKAEALAELEKAKAEIDAAKAETDEAKAQKESALADAEAARLLEEAAKQEALKAAALAEDAARQEAARAAALAEEASKNAIKSEPVVNAPVDTAPKVEASSGDFTYILMPSDERPPKDVVYKPESKPAEPPVAYHTEPPKTTYYQPTYPLNGGASSVPQIFSVPTVTSLEYGKYYLQIGAYQEPAHVEQELAKLKWEYPLVILCIGNPEYRILVGPYSSGEAGVVLNRLQRAGYKDAFLRTVN